MGFIIGPALSGHMTEYGLGFHFLALVTALLFVLNCGRFVLGERWLKAFLLVYHQADEVTTMLQFFIKFMDVSVWI